MDENKARLLSIQLMETTCAAYFTTIDENGFPHTEKKQSGMTIGHNTTQKESRKVQLHLKGKK